MMEIVTTTESTDKDVKYLNINIAKEEIDRQPDVVRVFDGYNCLEFKRTDIKQDTVLPKKHGRLIDADKLKEEIIKHSYSNTFCKKHNIDSSINLGVVGIIIGNAPIIIPETKGEE